LRRRTVLGGLIAVWAIRVARAERRRYRIGLANLDETPGVTLEGLGFTGADVRSGFELAARRLPVDMVYFDNAGDPERAVANADAAIAAHVDLLIEYNADTAANAEIARRLSAARIPAIALVEPLPAAPRYVPDNLEAGRIAGRALGSFAQETWAGTKILGVLIGDLTDPSQAVRERVQGVIQGAQDALPGFSFAMLDTGGQSVRAEALLTKFLMTERGRRVLIATLDDLSAIYARNAIALNARQSDCVIVSQGCDRNIHGGINEKKELDPSNRSSVVLGSVAYFMDRYGYEVLPLALRLLARETLPPLTVRRPVLITGANIFQEYPPFDVN
jgi:ABC-type sugar transport system substrate-binding protein